MNKYLFVYHYFSDGEVYFIMANSRKEAIEKFKNIYNMPYVMQLEIYNINELNTDQKL